MRPKIIRMTTVPISMNIILKGQLGFINQFYEVIGVTGDDEKHFSAIAQREGIRMEPIEMARNISVKRDMTALFQLIKLFRKERPYIVHTHTPKAGLLGMIAAWWTNVPVRLHTLGGTPFVGSKGVKALVLFFSEWLTYKLANKVYPNSTGLSEILIRKKVLPKQKVKILGRGSSNGVDLKKFSIEAVDRTKNEIRADFGFNSDHFIYLFVGRLAKEKGILELISAFMTLRERHNNIKLALVGTFEKENGMLPEETLQIISDDEGIHFLGRFDDVSPLYKMSDVFVLPSYREGFPNALLEACAMSIPIITTNINGCNEIISNNETGLLIPPRQIEPLEKAMKQFYLDSDLRLATGNNARENVQLYFQNKHLWQAWKSEYDYWISYSKNSFQ